MTTPKTLPVLTCQRPTCGHTWTPRKLPVYLCPKCHSPKWDEQPRR